MAKSEYMANQIPWNRRGIKACPSCGKIQGQRKLICANENCALRKKLLAEKIPFDPIKLITNDTTTIFSLRAKERNAYPRNFAEITEVTLSLERNSSLVTRNAICYVESCKYEHLSEAVCKHIKACNLDGNQSQQINIPNAEVYALSREVLWNLNIDVSQKQRLWQLYNEDGGIIPAVQRLNGTTFVVKCDKSKTFPAGRLHVTVKNVNSINSKKPTHFCACKKLKIILEPDNSLVMQKEVCEHLLLVLAAVLSKPNGKSLYTNFTSSLKSFWVPNELEKPLGRSQVDFFGNIGDIVDDIAGTADDIFIFDDNLLGNDNLPDLTDIVFDLTPADFMLNRTGSEICTGASPEIHNKKPFVFQNLPDLTDIVFDLTPADFMYAQNESFQSTNKATVSSLLYAGGCGGDPKLVSSCNLNENDIDICFDSAISTKTTTATTLAAIATAKTMITAPTSFYNNVEDDSHNNNSNNNNVATQLELSDCNIELMDQFQLTDRIDIDLEEEEPTDTTIFDSLNSISVLAATTHHTQNSKPQATGLAPITIALTPEVTETVPYFEPRTISTSAAIRNCARPGDSLLKANQRLSTTANGTTLEALPPIELPTIEVLKKAPLKASQLVSEIKTRKFPHVHAKRALIVNASSSRSNHANATDKNEKDTTTVNYMDCINTEPSLSYSAWLEYVIETINDSIDIVEKTDVTHTFHVHEEIFSHFSKSFSVGVKRRIPNSTEIIKSGKYKGLNKYVWYFPSSATIRRIFSTKNLCLQVERVFEQSNDGSFIPFVRQPPESDEINGNRCDTKKRRVFPKLSLYVAHILFDCNDEAGFKLEWLPNAFSKSHFGILTIEFSLGIKDPSAISAIS